MSDYRFVRLPSNASVASLVTLAVCAWFLAAAAAILDDPTSPYIQRELQRARVVDAVVAVVPQAHFAITVEARRGDWSGSPLSANSAAPRT
jgi:hypothetical protein